MKQKYYKAAELVHSTLRAQTNCYRQGIIIPAKFVIAIDDDATSAMWAARVFYEIYEAYGFYPTILCVGGKGIMSKHTHEQSEAELLASTVQKLGISPDKIVILGEGRNSGDNVLAVAQYLGKNVNTNNEEETADIIWCVTQRLSLRLERTVAKQAAQLSSYYYVIEQKIDEVMRLYNGKGLCEGEMLLHELASVLNRCEAYAGTFQKPLDFPIANDVRLAAKLLEDNFRLKLPNKNLKSYWQLCRLYFAILTNKRKMQAELDCEIKDFYRYLVNCGLIF